MTRVEQAIAALNMLAAPAEKQIRWLSNFFGIDLKEKPEHNIDEIVLEYDDIAKASADMYDSGEITQEQSIELVRLDDFLAKLSDTQPQDFWTVGALINDRQWDEVRHKAAECLRLLHA